MKTIHVVPPVGFKQGSHSIFTCWIDYVLLRTCLAIKEHHLKKHQRTSSTQQVDTHGLTANHTLIPHHAMPQIHYCYYRSYLFVRLSKGVPLPEDCPVGKMSDSTGLKMVSECQPCQGGYFCNGTGLTQPSGPCDPG